MRIAYFVSWYPMVSLTFIRREIRALEEQGFELLRFALEPWAGELKDEADLEEARCTRYVKQVGVVGALVAVLATLATRPLALLRTLGLSCRLARRSDRRLLWHLFYLVEACILARWLREAKAQHVHAHFASNAAEIVMLAHELGGPGYSFTVHGPDDFDRASALNYAEKVARSRFVAAISDFCRSQLYRWARHEDWDKISIVRCGLDRQFLQAPAAPVPEAPRLVNVGRLCAAKGQLLLVEAAALLQKRGVRFELLLVGDGEQRADVERTIARHGLGETVRITGWQTNSGVLEELSRSRGLVLPSLAEGLPVVIMESLAVERPVLTTYIAGIPELVVHGENGWLVPAGNVELLADAMETVLRAPVAELQRMGRVGRAHVAARHDINAEVATLKHLITSHVQKESAAPSDFAQSRSVGQANAVARDG